MDMGMQVCSNNAALGQAMARAGQIFADAWLVDVEVGLVP